MIRLSVSRDLPILEVDMVLGREVGQWSEAEAEAGGLQGGDRPVGDSSPSMCGGAGMSTTRLYI